KLLDDALDVLADIAGLGQRRGIDHDERHFQAARQRFRQQRLAGAAWPDQQYVAFGNLDRIVAAIMRNALVVIVNSDSQNLLGLFLPDHILIELRVNLARLRQLTHGIRAGTAEFMLEQINAITHAKLANISGWSG